MRVFSQGTCEAQNFLLRTSIDLYSKTRGISEIYLLEREISVTYSFIRVPSVKRKIDKNISPIVCGLHRK